MNTFPKSERIYLQKEIDELFTPGNAKSITEYPIRMVYRFVTRENETDPKVKVLVSVAKKRLHKAVDRVRAKRQMREAYRLNKPHTSKATNIALIWLANEPQDSMVVHAAIVKILGNLSHQ